MIERLREGEQALTVSVKQFELKLADGQLALASIDFTPIDCQFDALPMAGEPIPSRADTEYAAHASRIQAAALSTIVRLTHRRQQSLSLWPDPVLGRRFPSPIRRDRRSRLCRPP